LHLYAPAKYQSFRARPRAGLLDDGPPHRLRTVFRKFNLEVEPVDVVDFAPAGRDVYSAMTRLGSRSVGAQHLGMLAGWRHISLLTERRVLRGWFVAINMSLLRSEEQFQVALETTERGALSS